MRSDTLTVDDAAVKQAVGSMTSDLAALSDLVTVAPIYDDAIQSSPDSAAELVSVDKHAAAFAGSGASVYVSGAPGFNADYFNAIDDSTPVGCSFVLGLSFILLLLAFRSIVVPIRAITMNLLSVGAAYGLSVLVFQKAAGIPGSAFKSRR